LNWLISSLGGLKIETMTKMCVWFLSDQQISIEKTPF